MASNMQIMNSCVNMETFPSCSFLIFASNYNLNFTWNFFLQCSLFIANTPAEQKNEQKKGCLELMNRELSLYFIYQKMLHIILSIYKIRIAYIYSQEYALKN